MKSMCSQSSNELQTLHRTTGYQDNSSWKGNQLTCPIDCTLMILSWLFAICPGLPTVFHIFAHTIPMEERSRAFGYLVALGSIGQTVAALVSKIYIFTSKKLIFLKWWSLLDSNVSSHWPSSYQEWSLVTKYVPVEPDSSSLINGKSDNHLKNMPIIFPVYILWLSGVFLQIMIILHTTLQWQMQNTDQTENSQKTPCISPP